MNNNYDNNGFNQFQPGQPLFSNSFNNTVDPTQGNQPSMNQIDNGVEPPLFGNNQVMANNVSNIPSFEPVQQDVPPVLAPIKNLNEAPVVSGPSLDVLSPMNIAPSNPAPQNILSNYENGNNINIMQHQIQNEYQAPVMPEAPAPAAEPSYNMPNFGPVPYQAPVMPEAPAPVAEPSYNMPNFGPVPVAEPSYNIPEPAMEPIPNSVSEPEKDPEESKPEGTIYDIVDKPTESDSSVEIINDLGLDENLNTDDTDIMDLDDDKKMVSEEPKPIEEALPSDNSLVTKAVDELKLKVEELKKAGYNIEIDEFDFEQMFQLIIKINK